MQGKGGGSERIRERMRGTQRKITDEIEGEGESNWEEEGDGWRGNRDRTGEEELCRENV